MTNNNVNRLSSPHSDDEYLLDNQSEPWTAYPTTSATSATEAMNRMSTRITIHQLDLAYALLKTG